jgi:hypothetical protein
VSFDEGSFHLVSLLWWIQGRIFDWSIQISVFALPLKADIHRGYGNVCFVPRQQK